MSRRYEARLRPAPGWMSSQSAVCEGFRRSRPATSAYPTSVRPSESQRCGDSQTHAVARMAQWPGDLALGIALRSAGDVP
jgi:hypothetical protein